jgi:multidrug efflux pump subunit AcrA (membrane-fusion protein)
LPFPPVTLTDLPLTATPTGQAALPDSSDPLHGALVELAASLDAREIETQTLKFARAILRADRVSAWADRDGAGAFTCWVASGEGSERVTGASGPLDALNQPMEDEDGMTVIVAPLRPTAASTSGALRVARDLAAHGAFTPGERVALTRLAEVAGVALRNAERMAANDRTGDLELVMEMSRAIGSTLDLDRVMRAVVNLAMRAITFDRGAIALYERGKCDIRALAGVEKFDPEDPELQDLAVRGAWAAGVGEAFYLSDRTEAGSDAERLFLQIFEGDLEADGVVSGLYIPLKDDEGVLGILLFEAERPEFATERQRELATILANQATVALRNAQLYQQVPLADTLGAIHAKKEAFLALPAMRRLTWAVIAVVAIASLTLIQWPLRVEANQPVFRPNVRTEIRPLVDGVVERVFIGEGARVARGDPIVQLRDAEQRTSRDAALSDAASAEREATAASARSDAAEERLQRMRADALRREASVLDEQVRAALVRSPVAGIVLTPRPQERLGSWVDAGSQLIVVGRTDTLELDFNVDERDIGRVQVGDEVRLRVDAYPQRTFVGRVTVIGVDRWTGGPVDRSNGETTSASMGGYPLRALVPNDSGFIRPGMVAYARVLTDPASVIGRVIREPWRRLRLFWWRLWS